MKTPMEESLPSEMLIDPLDNGDAAFQRRTLVPGWLTSVAYPTAMLVVFGMALSGSLVDKYFSSGETSFSLKLADGTSHTFKVPPTTIRSVDLHTESESGTVKIIEYVAGQHPLDDADFENFTDKLVGMRYTEGAWTTAKVLGYLVISLSGIALGLQIVFREVPSTHAFKPESFVSSVGWKNSLPVWLLLAVSFLGITRLLLVTSFVQSLMTRLALSVVRDTLPREEWENFLHNFKDNVPREFQLEILRSLGLWYADRGTQWAFSAISVLVVILFTNAIFIGVFYSDIKLVRSRLGVDTQLEFMQQQLKGIPSLATVLPLWVSVGLFLISWLATSLVARFVLNSGKEMNRLPWVSNYEQMVIPVNDIFISHTGTYWFDPPTVVDGTVLGWVPLVIVVSLGSIDRIACLSKLFQTIAMGYFFRIPSIIATIIPASTSVLQAPKCYSDEYVSFWNGLTTMEFCNDLVYSGHATLVVTPALIIILMIVYGPYLNKALPILTVCVGALFSVSVIVAGRVHYTADVLITTLVCTLIGIVNAPAWKVIFSYSRYQLRIGSATSITKVAALFEEVCDRVVTITKSRRIDYKLTRWDVMDQKLNKLKTLIENASADLKQE